MTDNQKLDLILTEITGLKDCVENMQANMQDMQTDMQDMKDGMQNMQTDMQDMKDGMQNMQTDIQDMKIDIRDLRQHISAIELHLENVTDKNIMLLAENFIDLTNQLNQAVPAADKNRAYEVKVNYILEEVDKIKKEVSKLINKPA